MPVGELTRLLDQLDSGDLAERLRGDFELNPEFERVAPDVLADAAVLVPIVDRAEPGLILTRRTEGLSRHAGQVAFPGGRIDPGDESAIAAALREAEEEIALQPEAVRILGQMHLYETHSGFRIRPVIGLLPPDTGVHPNEAEVAEIFEVPLAHVLDPRHHQLNELMWRGAMRKYFTIDYGPHHIWGITAALIIQLAEVYHGRPLLRP